MVMARDRFLGGGHYRPARRRRRSATRRAGSTPAAPAWCSTWPAAPATTSPGCSTRSARRLGACVDLSAPALRRAARAHPRAAALGADAWQALPLADGSAALVLSVFGPRNAAEIRRVLAPGGALIVATPGPDHQRELRRPLGLIGIDERKTARLADAFGEYARAA